MDYEWIGYLFQTLESLGWLLLTGLCVWRISKPKTTDDFLYKALAISFLIHRNDANPPPDPRLNYVMLCSAIVFYSWIASLPYTRPYKGKGSKASAMKSPEGENHPAPDSGVGRPDNHGGKES